jgi:hypothetical protein
VLVFNLHTLPTTITISVITDLHLHKGLLAGGWVFARGFLNDYYDSLPFVPSARAQ